MHNPLKSLCIFIITLFLTSCAPLQGHDQPVISDSSMEVSEAQSLGQTFVARYDGLQGIEIHLSPSEAIEGEFFLHLREEPGVSQDLASAQRSWDGITEPGFYRFEFEAQNDSNQKYYYLFLELNGEGSVKVSRARGDNYLDGAMYQNHVPINEQMTFQLIYNPFTAIWGLFREFITWIGIVLVSIAPFFLPGLALLTLIFPKGTEVSFPSRVALAGGISFALYPVLLLWTDLFGIHLGRLYAWLPSLLSLLYLGWKIRSWKPPLRIKSLLHNWYTSASSLPSMLLLLISGCVLFLRFYLIRSLDVPLWGDSVHHTMISQLIVQNNGLFDSWAPLADLQSLTYHYGFHANTAVLHWITGISIPQSVLWTGQIFNFMAVFALFPLVQKAGGGKWGGVIALLIAGLLSSMPNFYLNWGRYAQLAGQAILPAAVFLIWESTENDARNWSLIGLSCITLAGLGLTHYRVLIFAVIFFIPIILMNLRRKNRINLILKSIWLGLGAGLVFLPWFINTFQGRITTNFLRSLTIPASAVTDWTQQYNAIGDPIHYLPIALWILFTAASLLAIIKRMKGALVILSWWLLILLATNPHWLGLPGTGAISNFALFIAAYIPCAILVGIVAGRMMEHLSTKQLTALGILMLVLSIVGINLRVKDLDYENHTLVTRPDIRASVWIQDNMPPKIKFLTNAFFAYNDTVIVGSDGGWWLRLLAKRSTTLPPTSYGTEKGPRSDYRIWVNALMAEIRSKGIAHPDVLTILQEREVTHIYIGQRNGHVNYRGPDVLPVDLLLTNSHFQLIYHMDRVWIFKIL